MKNSLKLLLITIGTALTLSLNVSCSPTEAAIVGGLAGAAIGLAASDGGHREHRNHGRRGNHRGHGNHGGGHGGHGGGHGGHGGGHGGHGGHGGGHGGW